MTIEHTIEIERVANINRATFKVRPGVNVLRGRNGAGKSEAIRAIQGAIAGDGSALEVQRGAAETERGRVKAFGVSLTLNRRREDITADADRGRSRAEGELEVRSLTGLDPLDLISPRGESPEVRDGRRIVTLCRMLSIEPDISRFGALAGYASPATRKAADLPEMAAKLKRDVQAAARDVETKLATVRGEASAHLSAAGDVTEAPADLVDWTGRASQLSVELHQIEARQRASDAASKAAAEAFARLDQARQAYSGPTSEEIAKEVAALNSMVTELREALANAEGELRDWASAEVSARRHERSMAEWQTTIEAAQSAVAVDPAEVDAARAALADAQARAKAAALDSERRKRRTQGVAKTVEADALSAEAAKLRESVDGVESVLTDAINAAGDCGLRVVNGRLVCDEFGDAYDRLSHGQRALVAVRIIARSFGDGGAVAVIPQEAGEAMDADALAELDRIARDHNVVIITAAHDVGELRMDSAQ